MSQKYEPSSEPLHNVSGCRGTSLTKKRTPLARTLPQAYAGVLEGGRFLMGEVPLQGFVSQISTAPYLR